MEDEGGNAGLDGVAYIAKDWLAFVAEQLVSICCKRLISICCKILVSIHGTNTVRHEAEYADGGVLSQT